MRRVVVEVSRHLVATAGSVPEFTARLGREQLVRLRVIAESVEDTAGRVVDALEDRERRKRAEEARVFEERYRDVIARELDRVELFGIDLTYEETKRQTLSVAYVALRSLTEPARRHEQH
jgi:hypothetical protein